MRRLLLYYPISHRRLVSKPCLSQYLADCNLAKTKQLTQVKQVGTVETQMQTQTLTLVSRELLQKKHVFANNYHRLMPDILPNRCGSTPPDMVGSVTSSTTLQPLPSPAGKSVLPSPAVSDEPGGADRLCLPPPAASSSPAPRRVAVR